MRYLTKLCVALTTLLATSCIDNDIPYPDVLLNIAGVEGTGFSVSGIDVSQRVVTITLDETTDIRNVRIDKVAFDVEIHNTTIDRETLIDGIEASRELTGTFDLRSPLYVTLSLYQDYEWAIVAEQHIDRRFAVAGQMGATVFDIENRTATAYMPKNADLTDITVNSLRLEPEVEVEGVNTTSYSPSVEELSGDFTTVRFVDVTCHGRTERWLLYVLHTDKSVQLTQADAWSRVIWLYAEGIEGVQKGFRYRKQGEEAWNEVPNINVEGGSFSARLQVEEQTTYELKAYCGDEETDVETRTTEGIQQLPNSGMEDWSHPKSPWLPYFSDESGEAINAYWGTGNNASTTLGEKYNVTTPYGPIYGEDDGALRPGTPGKTAAQLQSRYVAVKLAAGNIFVGKLAGVRGGTHGVVNFGRPFTLRPTALKVWVKYNCGTITDIGSVPIGTSLKQGDPDNGSIYIALGTWTKEKYGYAKDNELMGTDESPVSIDTREVSTFFNSKSEDVIAYGERIFTENVPEWTQITIPLDYNATDKVPTHLILVCSASRWGDYFTGSRQSAMWVDDFELVYE